MCLQREMVETSRISGMVLLVGSAVIFWLQRAARSTSTCRFSIKCAWSRCSGSRRLGCNATAPSTRGASRLRQCMCSQHSLALVVAAIRWCSVNMHLCQGYSRCCPLRAGASSAAPRACALQLSLRPNGSGRHAHSSNGRSRSGSTARRSYDGQPRRHLPLRHRRRALSAGRKAGARNGSGARRMPTTARRTARIDRS